MSSQLQIHSSSFADTLPTVLLQKDSWASLFPQDYQQNIFQLKIDRFSTLQQWPLCLGFLMELTDNFDWHDNAQTLHNETDAWVHTGSAYASQSRSVYHVCHSFVMNFFLFFWELLVYKDLLSISTWHSGLFKWLSSVMMMFSMSFIVKWSQKVSYRSLFSSSTVSFCMSH